MSVKIVINGFVRIGKLSFKAALDMEGVAVRAGHHCAEPLVHSLGTNSTVRASLAFYNYQADCDQLINAIKETKEFFKGELR